MNGFVVLVAMVLGAAGAAQAFPDFRHCHHAGGVGGTGALGAVGDGICLTANCQYDQEPGRLVLAAQDGSKSKVVGCGV